MTVGKDEIGFVNDQEAQVGERELTGLQQRKAARWRGDQDVGDVV